MNLGANLPNHPKKHKPQPAPNVPLPMQLPMPGTDVVAQRIELVAFVHQVAQSGVDCVNRTAICGHEEARQSVAHAPVVGEHLEHVDRRHFRSDDNVLDVHQVETGFGQLEGVAVLGADEDDRGFEGLLGFAGDLSQSSLGCLCFGIVAVIGEREVRFVDDDGGVVAFFDMPFTNSDKACALSSSSRLISLSFERPGC